MAVWLQVKVSERGLGLRPRLYAGSVCDAQRCCSCSARLVWLYKCCSFAFFRPSLHVVELPDCECDFVAQASTTVVPDIQIQRPIGLELWIIILIIICAIIIGIFLLCLIMLLLWKVILSYIAHTYIHTYISTLCCVCISVTIEALVRIFRRLTKVREIFPPISSDSYFIHLLYRAVVRICRVSARSWNTVSGLEAQFVC